MEKKRREAEGQGRQSLKSVGGSGKVELWEGGGELVGGSLSR